MGHMKHSPEQQNMHQNAYKPSAEDSAKAQQPALPDAEAPALAEHTNFPALDGSEAALQLRLSHSLKGPLRSLSVRSDAFTDMLSSGRSASMRMIGESCRQADENGSALPPTQRRSFALQRQHSKSLSPDTFWQARAHHAHGRRHSLQGRTP